jgi:diadenosine tetraphosphatase ApaH/serine/threonine PP2A family protein phosphatase
MTSKLHGGSLCGFLVLANGCSLEHHAPLRSAELPALAPSVLHSNRLWIDVADRMPDNDCVAPGNARLLCFERLRTTVGTALSRSLWSSFPGVDLLTSKGAPPSDYVLHVDLDLEALPPDASAPGWSAGARGHWRLERNGQTLAGEQVASRSRTEFAYGAPLGIGASEVIDAIAVRIGMTLGGIPETRLVEPVPLPEVATAPLAPKATLVPAAAAQAKTAAF